MAREKGYLVAAPKRKYSIRKLTKQHKLRITNEKKVETPMMIKSPIYHNIFSLFAIFQLKGALTYCRKTGSFVPKYHHTKQKPRKR